MKTIFSLTFALIVINLSQAQTIKDGNGHLIASIDGSGIIMDMNEDTLGYFLTNGEVKDMNLALMGTFDQSGNYIESSSDTIGNIDVNGVVKDATGTLLGSIEDNGDILDGNNDKIGWCSHTNKKTWIAGYFFIFFREI